MERQANAEIQKLKFVCCKVQEKANPASGMTEGKERSISPEVTENTKLKPKIINSGKDKKIAEYIPTVKKTVGAEIMNALNITTKNRSAPTTALKRKGITIFAEFVLMMPNPS